MPARKTRVLVVDDDIRLLRMMRRMLEMEGYAVITASDGETALQLLDGEEAPDLMLLDVMMPGLEGYTLCRRIREFSQLPIIMVTAKGKDEEKVKGLDAGADDYVTKPFSASELVARVRAVLRRSSLTEEPIVPVFRCQDLKVDFARRQVFLGEREVNLTATEYRVLSYLVRNADRVLTPEQILTSIWGEEYAHDDNLVQANIARLRRKLGEDARDPRFIFTRPGIGYVFVRSGG